MRQRARFGADVADLSRRPGDGMLINSLFEVFLESLSSFKYINHTSLRAALIGSARTLLASVKEISCYIQTASLEIR